MSFCIVMGDLPPFDINRFRFGRLGTQRCAVPNQIRPTQSESATSTRRTWGTLGVRWPVIGNWVGLGAWASPLPFAGGSARRVSLNSPAIDDPLRIHREADFRLSAT